MDDGDRMHVMVTSESRNVLEYLLIPPSATLFHFQEESPSAGGVNRIVMSHAWSGASAIASDGMLSDELS